MTFFEGWNTIASGHESGDIRLWNMDTGLATTLRQVNTWVDGEQGARVGGGRQRGREGDNMLHLPQDAECNTCQR